jgi:hypothetical protein
MFGLSGRHDSGSQASLVCSDSSKFCIVSHLLLSNVALFPMLPWCQIFLGLYIGYCV